MKKLSAGEARGLNNLSPGDQNVMIGDRIRDLEENALVELSYAIVADLTGGLDAIQCPFAVEILDVIVQARATSGSGTVTAQKGGNAITDAIVMAVDTTVVRAGTLDVAYSLLAEGQYINLVTNGAADRGLVTVIARRI